MADLLFIVRLVYYCTTALLQPYLFHFLVSHYKNSSGETAGKNFIYSKIKGSAEFPSSRHVVNTTGIIIIQHYQITLYVKPGILITEGSFKYSASIRLINAQSVWVSTRPIIRYNTGILIIIADAAYIFI